MTIWIGPYRLRIKRPVPDRNSFFHLTVFKWHSASCLLLLSSCYPIRQYLRRWMDCLALKNHLLPCTYCVILIPLALLPLCPSSFPPPIFHSSCLSLSPLYSSFHLFAVMHSLSLSFPLSFPKMDCLSVFSLFSTHPCIPNTHKQNYARTPQIPLSFWLSSSAILAVSSCFSLSVFSKNSINQRLPGFFTYDYLWSCCSYHFHAPDKCTEYSTQPRQEYFIISQTKRGNTCCLLKLGLVFHFSAVSYTHTLNLHITHSPPKTHFKFHCKIALYPPIPRMIILFSSLFL